jgi:antitoxin (DNA-binding transcriptional repressor) of toxin-antitoxin stability system
MAVEAGEPFIIARAGKPVAKVTPYSGTPRQRIGFLKGKFDVPDEFDTLFQKKSGNVLRRKPSAARAVISQPGKSLKKPQPCDRSLTAT